jgi:glycosyltransferase involved in cell wall biosynthesis
LRPKGNTQKSALVNDYFRTKYGISVRSKIFIYSGLLIKGRGIEIILEAFGCIREAHVVFMGFGDLDKDILNASKIYKNIHLHGHVDNDEVSNYISYADYGICLLENTSLSDYLALPNKLFEYLFTNLPVIASNFPAISRVLKECRGGVVCDATAKTLIECIETLMTGSAIFEIDNDMLKRYSWEQQENNLLDIYYPIIQCDREVSI